MTYYDNVKVTPDRVVGKVNGGWKVITSATESRTYRAGCDDGDRAQTIRYILNLLAKTDANGVRRLDDPLVASKNWRDLCAS